MEGKLKGVELYVISVTFLHCIPNCVQSTSLKYYTLLHYFNCVLLHSYQYITVTNLYSFTFFGSCCQQLLFRIRLSIFEQHPKLLLMSRSAPCMAASSISVWMCVRNASPFINVGMALALTHRLLDSKTSMMDVIFKNTAQCHTSQSAITK